ncbi:MAG: hypothetical protein C0497_03010 [Gemmatimonas sp.]|nr:hypothetical protein [Gemmatimonas sp.]
MPMNFINRTTSAAQLKSSLDISIQRTRAIADRIARASFGVPAGDPAGQPVFSIPGAGDAAAARSDGPVDLESEMVSLADEQLRYEVAAKLLEKTYAGLRAALQER